jgi:hypothetical protein
MWGEEEGLPQRRCADSTGQFELTTKVTKRTKFGNINILTFRGLRVLRGEMVFTSLGS